MSARAVPVPALQNISRNIFSGYSRHILITGASAASAQRWPKPMPRPVCGSPWPGATQSG
jgi:hypothetical protein